MAFGLQPDAYRQTDDPCYLWPCNVPVYNLWLCLQTQWRTGADGGRTGLDYDAVATYLHEVARIRRPRKWAEAWRGIQAMEQAALDEWDKQHTGK